MLWILATEDSIVISPPGVPIVYFPRPSFQAARREFADRQSRSEFYVVADDDCLPDPGILAGILVLQKYPTFRILSAWPQNAKVNPWRPEDYEPITDLVVMEHVSVGGIRFCRRPVLQVWPELRGSHYDADQCEAIRGENGRVGYLKHIKMTHLGEGCSSLTNAGASEVK